MKLTQRALAVTVAAIAAASFAAPATAAPGSTPVAGSVMFNEYDSDPTPDYVELLVTGNGVDLRGLRFSDNELVGGVLNANEQVLTFGQDAFLENVPKGTVIAVYTATGATVDTDSTDFSMKLAPGSGVTSGVDGLGGSVNGGLSTGGEALYLYLPGADGTSAGTDNVYIDFMSFEADGGDAPAGLADVNIASVSDSASLTVGSCDPASNDVAANWVASDASATSTPGLPNAGQNLTACRGPVVEVPVVDQTVAIALVAVVGVGGAAAMRRRRTSTP